jgi:thiol-disulfide isomerase/thioredoxin
MKHLIPLACGLLLALISPAAAQNPPGFKELKIGDPAPDFKLIGIDDKMMTLADFKDTKLLAVLFTSAHCPVSHAAVPRLIKLFGEMKDKGFDVVAINPNHPDGLRPDELGYSKYGDSFEEMKPYAKERASRFPISMTATRSPWPWHTAASPRLTCSFSMPTANSATRAGSTIAALPGEEDVTKPDLRNAVVALLRRQNRAGRGHQAHRLLDQVADEEGCRCQGRREMGEAAGFHRRSMPTGVKKLRANDTKKYRLINMWSTTCAPCVEEFPALMKVSRRMGLRPFELVTISTDLPQDKEKAEAFLKKFGAGLPPHLNRDCAEKGAPLTATCSRKPRMDRSSRRSIPNGKGPQPHTIFLKPGGEVGFRHTGMLTEEQLTGKGDRCDDTLLSPGTMRPFLALLAAILVTPSPAGAESRVLDAADFGTVGDGIHDDGPAVLKMIDAAKQSGQPATLRFARGKNYHLKTGRERYAFPVEGVSNLTIDGGGSLFTVDSGIRFMRAVGSKHLVVSDLQVDYSPLPFADGVIVAKDAAAGSIDVMVDESFALPPGGGPTKQDGEQAFFAVLWHPGAYSEAGDPYFTRHHFFLREIAGAGPDRIVRLISSDEKIANLIHSIRLNEWQCSIPVRGIAHCFGPGPNILIEKCTDVAFTRVDVWSAPWFAFTVIDNDGSLVFKNVNIRPKPGTRRMTSSWRDGFHIKNNTASLLWDGCTLQGMNDDAFNISCHTSRIRKILTPTRIEISQNYPLGIARMRAGDTLRFYHTGRGVDPGSARIVRADYAKPVFTLELDQGNPRT